MLTPTRFIGVLALVAAFVAPASAQQRTIDEFFDEFTATWVRNDPDLATAIRYFSGEEQDRLERQMTPNTRAWQLDRIRRAREGVQQLQTFDRAKLTDAQRLSADLMQWQLEGVVRGERYPRLSLPARSVLGRQRRSRRGVDAAASSRDSEGCRQLSRAARSGRRAHGRSARRGADARAQEHDSAAIHPADDADSDADVPRAAAREESAGRARSRRRLAAIESLDAGARRELQSKAARIVAAEVYPAWRRAIALLESVVPKSNDDAGLWRFQGGDAAYAYALNRFTTTELTADQIHEIGLQQVARIESEMDAILRKLGRSEGAVRDRIAKLKNDLSYPDPDLRGEPGGDHARHRQAHRRTRSSAAPRCSTCSQGRRWLRSRFHAFAKRAPPRTTTARRSTARARRSFRCRCGPSA